MRWSDLPLKPSDRTLREFAGLWCLFFSGLGAWHGLVQNNSPLGRLLAVAGFTVGLCGLVYPRAVRPIFVTWLVLAFPIGWVVSKLLLVVLFFGLVTPVALLFRLQGRDALQLRREQKQSYWTAKERSGSPARYFRQY